MTLKAGIDIGGTAIKLGVADERGRLVRRAQLAFDRDAGFETMAERIADTLSTIAADIVGIGIAIPGWPDPDSGVLNDGGNNLPAFAGPESLSAFLAHRFDLPTSIDNDGTCAALGELRFGAGKGLSRFVMLTLGTGVGGGVVIDGKPVLGALRAPAELGAMCLHREGRVNYSGIPGSLESAACAGALVDHFADAAGDASLTAKDVFDLARTGNEQAADAVDRVACSLAQACGIWANTLNIEACILGGGMAAAGDLLLERVRAHLPGFTWPLQYRNVRVMAASLGNDAGIIGATVRLEEPL